MSEPLVIYQDCVTYKPKQTIVDPNNLNNVTTVKGEISLNCEMISKAVHDSMIGAKKVGRLSTDLSVDGKPSSKLKRVVSFYCGALTVPTDTKWYDGLYLKDVPVPSIIDGLMVPSHISFNASEYENCHNFRCVIKIMKETKGVSDQDINEVISSWYNCQRESVSISGNLYDKLRPVDFTFSTKVAYRGKTEFDRKTTKIAIPVTIPIMKADSYYVDLNEHFNIVLRNIFKSD